MTDEKTLIISAQAGDHFALDQLFLDHYESVLRYSRRLVWDEEEAADLATKAMVRAFECLNRYNPAKGAQFRTWVCRIAYNCYLDHCRRRSRRIVTVSLNEPAIEDTTADPGWRFDSDPAIAKCIEKLPEKMWWAIYFFYGQEEPLEYIAQRWNCPANTVKSDLFRARQQLRKCLELSKAIAARELAHPGDTP